MAPLQETYQVEIFYRNNRWYAQLKDASEETCTGSGSSIANALHGLANDVAVRQKGIVAAQQAASDGRGTRIDRHYVEQSLQPENLDQ